MRKASLFVLASIAAAAILAACSHSDTDKSNAADDGPIPVSVTSVIAQDVPLYFNGLGTVAAFNTATILAQVSGQLVAVPFKEGDEVKAGDLIAQVDPRAYQATLDQALAKKAQDEATLAGDQLDLKRYRSLLPGGYVNGQQVDQQEAKVKSAEALVKADDAAIEGDRVQLSFCTIRAPFAGVIGIRQVDVGNLVSATNQTGIAVLTQIKPIAVTFTLPEQSLAQIRAADTQTLTVVAVNRDNQTELGRGKLVAFDNQIDQTTGTIKLKASFANDDKTLWPGQFVNARLLVRVQHGVLTVPAQAVQLGPTGAFVYVVDDKRAVQMKPVTPAGSEGGVTVIAQGLNAGDKVVVDGQSRLQPGSKVQVTEVPAAAVTAPTVEAAAPGSAPQAAPMPAAHAPAMPAAAAAPIHAPAPARNQAPTPAPTQASIPAPIRAPTPAPTPTPNVAPLRAPLAQAAPGSTGGTYGPINSQETFWSIASRLRPGPQVTIEQVQLAIYRANPQAFGNGSFNRLLQGSTLRVPSLAEMLKSPPALALAAVSAWRQGRAPDIDKQTHQSDEAQANPVPASSPQPDNPKQAQPAKGVQPIEHAAAASPAAANPAPAQRAPKQIPAPVVTIPYQPAPAQAAQGQAGTAQGGGSSGSGNSQ